MQAKSQRNKLRRYSEKLTQSQDCEEALEESGFHRWPSFPSLPLCPSLRSGGDAQGLADGLPLPLPPVCFQGKGDTDRRLEGEEAEDSDWGFELPGCLPARL